MIARAPTQEASFGDYFALLKPRVMSLVVFTALVGLFAAPTAVHPMIAFSSILFIAIGGGASGALNMWWDAAGLFVFTVSASAEIYTMWLKRWTPQNIVIGGAAGAFPPMIGWAVATGGISFESVFMFALIFVWTPPHFWALALFMRNDYDDAKVPMLTVTHGRRSTRAHILGYTLALAAVAVGAGFTSLGGPVYLVVSVILNIAFIKGAVDIWRRDEADSETDDFKVERSFFKLSLAYLFLHFSAILIDVLVKQLGLGAVA